MTSQQRVPLVTYLLKHYHFIILLCTLDLLYYLLSKMVTLITETFRRNKKLNQNVQSFDYFR